MDLAQSDQDALMALGSWFEGIVNWWGTISWGTAPEWLAAIGTISAVGVALLQTHREGVRHRQQESVDAERIARLEAREEERVAKMETRERRDRLRGVELRVSPPQLRWVSAGGGLGKEVTVRPVVMRNGSAAAISDVWFYGISDDEPLRRIRTLGPGREEAFAVTADVIQDDGYAEMHFYDEEWNQWVVDTDGSLNAWEDVYVSSDPSKGALKVARADSVTPQPSSPAPNPSEPPSAPPDPGAAS